VKPRFFQEYSVMHDARTARDRFPPDPSIAAGDE